MKKAKNTGNSINKRNIEFNLGVFVILAVIFVVVGIVLVRGRTNYAVTASYDSISFEECIVMTSGYEQNNGIYIPVNSDPQLTISVGSKNEAIYAFKIKLSDEVDLEKVQVYFGRDGESFSENDSKLFGEGMSDTIEVISLAPFKYARIDIDSEFEVEQLGVADELQMVNLLSFKWYIVICVIGVILAAGLAFLCLCAGGVFPGMA